MLTSRRVTTLIVAVGLALGAGSAYAASELAYGTQAIGSTDEAAYAGSGNASVISALKGVYSALSGGGGGTVTQGTPAAVGNAWPVTLAIGGALNAVGNPIFTAPGTGAAWVLGAGTAEVGKVNPGAATAGNPTGNATTPFAAQMMVSDGTNLQRLLAPLILGDGVNGNNMLAVGGWLWNGTTWDRAPGTAAAGAITRSSSQYPNGAVPETISATGTTAATTATLAASAGVTTYICGFSIRANATAAATGNATVTGTITGTMNYTQWTAPLASGLGVVEQIFTPCIPASATNTTIAVVSAAPGLGGTVSVSAWGYKL